MEPVADNKHRSSRRSTQSRRCALLRAPLCLSDPVKNLEILPTKDRLLSIACRPFRGDESGPAGGGCPRDLVTSYLVLVVLTCELADWECASTTHPTRGKRVLGLRRRDLRRGFRTVRRHRSALSETRLRRPTPDPP